MGTGLNLPLYPAGVRLTGVDLSPRMLEIARRRAQELGREVELHETDAHALPFPEGSFDTVVCTYSLCNIPDLERAVAEMKRVLRPGGRLLLLDHIAGPSRAQRVAQWLIERALIPLQGEHLRRPPTRCRWNTTWTVPTFTVIRSTGEAPVPSLRQAGRLQHQAASPPGPALAAGYRLRLA